MALDEKEKGSARSVGLILRAPGPQVHWWANQQGGKRQQVRRCYSQDDRVCQGGMADEENTQELLCGFTFHGAILGDDSWPGEAAEDSVTCRLVRAGTRHHQLMCSGRRGWKRRKRGRGRGPVGVSGGKRSGFRKSFPQQGPRKPWHYGMKQEKSHQKQCGGGRKCV